MSTTVDQRVLEMRFDNKQFEENVAESISTLEKLEKALQLDKIGNAFGAITQAAGKVDLSPIGNGIETVVVKFNALEMAAVQALSNIITDGINRLQNAVNSLTFDQMSAGWSKYEEKTASVQTIMAATGKTIEEVDEQLNRLNWFSDETSYSFTDMTSNVGKFTSVGVDLEDAVSAMEGIATWAALSGANATTASRAMYNLSQAMGVGSVKLMDWRSIENAGMATTEFKETALETAVALGTLTKSSDGLYKTMKGTEVTVQNFNSTLADDWFSSDVLMKSLNSYGQYANTLSRICEETGVSATKMDQAFEDWFTDARSFDDIAADLGISADDLRVYFEDLTEGEFELGRKAFRAAQEAKTLTDALDATKDAVSTLWMNIYEKLFGNYEQAKEFFTEFTEILWETFASPVDSLNDYLDKWNEQVDSTGRHMGDVFRRGVLDTLWSVHNVIKIVTSSLGAIIPPLTVENLAKLTVKFGEAAERLNNLTGSFSLSERTTERLQRVWGGLSAVFDIIGQALSSLKPLFNDIMHVVGVLADDFLSLSASVGDWLVELAAAIRDNYVFQKIMQDLHNLLTPVTRKISELYSAFREKISTKQFGSISDALQKIEFKLAPIRQFIYEVFRNGTPVSQALDDILSKNEKLAAVLGPIRETLQNIFNAVKEFFSGLDFSSILSGIWDFLKKIGDALGNLFSKENIAAGFKKVGDAAGYLKDKLEGLFKGFDAGNFFHNIGKGLHDLLDSLGKADLSGLFSTLTKGTMLYGGLNLGKLFGSASEGIEALTGSVKEGGIGGIFKSMFSPVTDVFDQLKETIGSFTKDTDDSKLKAIATSIGILTAALWVLSGVDTEKIDSGLKGLGGALAEMMGSIFALTKMDLSGGKQMKNVATAMIEMAAAVFILGKAIQPFADMDGDQLAKAGAALTVILGEMLGFIALFGNISKANTKGIFKASNGFDKQLKNAAKAMIELGAAIWIFAKALEPFTQMTWEQLGQAGAALTVILGEMLGWMAIANNFDSKKISKIAFAMIEMGLAMSIFSSVAKTIASIDPNGLLNAMVFITVVMIEMGLFIAAAEGLVSSAGKIAAISASMILLGIAMQSFAVVAAVISLLDPDGLIKSIAFMSVVMVELVAFLAIADAVSSNAGGIAAIAASMILLAIAMQQFAVAGIAFTAVKWGDMGKMGAVFVVLAAAMALMAPLLPTIGAGLTSVGVGLIAIGAGITLIGVGIASLSLGVLAGKIADIAQRFVWLSDNLLDLGVRLKNSISIDLFIQILGAIPKIVTEFISGLVSGIISGIGMIISSVGDLLSGLGDAILAFCDFVRDVGPALIDTVLELLISVTSALLERAPEILENLVKLLLKLLEMLNEYAPQILSSIVTFFIKIFDSLAEHIPELITSFMNFLGALFGAIVDAMNQASPDAVLKMIETVGLFDALILSAALLGPMIPGAMLGLVGMGAFVAELSLIVAALSSLSGLSDAISSGGDLLEALGNSIGKFVGGIIGGIGEGISDSFPKIADNLSAFMEHLQPFLDGVRSVDSSTIEAVGALTTAILALTVAEVLDGITRFFSGGSDLEGFGKKLSAFAPYFRSFADDVKGIDTAAVSTASEAIKTIADTFNNDTFKTGGVKQWFTGEVADLENFGKGLVAIGPSITEYSQSVAGLDVAVVENSAKAVEALTVMGKLPRKGGAIGWLKGDSDLVQFAEGLAVLGPKIMEYAESVRGLDPEIVTNSTLAAEALITLSEKLPSKSLVDRIFGNDKMQDFINSIVTFGKGISEFYNTIAGVDVAKMNGLIDSIQKLVDFSTSVGDMKISLDKSFGASMKKVAETGIADFVGVIESNYGNARSKGEQFADKFKEGVKSKAESIKTEFTNILDSMIKAVEDKQSDFQKSGALIIDAVTKGIQSAKDSMIRNLKETVAEGLRAIDSLYMDFYNIGVNLVTGFVRGLDSKLESVKDTVKKIGDTASDELKKVLDEESPSKVFYKIGSYAGEGFVNGIVPWVENAGKASDALAKASMLSSLDIPDFYTSGSDIGENFVSGLSSWATKAGKASSALEDASFLSVSDIINDFLQNDMEMEPVIRPVLDLSEIEEGSNRLDAMLSKQEAFAIGMDGTVPSGSVVNNSTNNTKNFGGFTFNIYAQGSDPNEIAQKLGAEISRRMRIFATI